MQQSSLTETDARREQSQTRQQSQKQEQSLSEGLLTAQAALDALLAGAGPEQLPARAVLALSSQAGNSTLLALLARRQTGPALVSGPPGAQPLTAPLDCRPAQPRLEAAPALDGSAFPASSPLEL